MEVYPVTRLSFYLRAFMLASFLLTINVSIAEAQNPTPNFWKCNNRIGGAWNFGKAPYACDVDPFGDPNILGDIYGVSVLIDGVPLSEERPRYMQELQPMLRDLAEFYLRRRKPDVSTAEMNAWIRAWYAIAHQESFWSHYRRGSDGRLKMMRGDFGHGHGLLQVDDRWHFVAVRDGVAANLVEHGIYAMDEYYAAWQRAPNQSCVSSPTDYVARTRSAWSAYNGGPSRICRWTNPNSPHASKDQQFYQKYQNQSWSNHIEDFNRESSVDMVCLAEGNSNCNGGGEVLRPEQGVLYAHNGGACVFDGAEFQCLPNLRDNACLVASFSLADTDVYELDNRFLEGANVNILDRHSVCTGSGIDLYRVGSVVVFGKNINMRATPGGERISTVPKFTVVQILDYEIRAQSLFPRYYMVQYRGEFGYVYAGDLDNSIEWLSPSPNRVVDPQPIVALGNKGEIVARNGINVRETPGGRKITAVRNGRVFTVLSVEFRGEENQIYYKIDTGNQRGFIYGGRVIPDSTTADWFTVQ